MFSGVISLLGLLSLLCLIIGMIYPKPFYRLLPQGKQRRLWVFLLFSCILTVCTMVTEATKTSNPEQTAKKAQATAAYTNSIGMKFVLIPAGSVKAEIPESKNAFDEVVPARTVTVNISKPFYLGIYEVTQEQWIAIMGSNPSKFIAWNNPVESVSWNDVQAFIQALNKKEGHNRYRLPTETEWEYAARAGTTTKYSFGNSEKLLEEYGWCGENSDLTSHPVGQKKPNPWGLYDMHGNVREWMQDNYWYGDHPSSSVTDPKGPFSGSDRVNRDCGWSHYAKWCHSAFRTINPADSWGTNLGFRLALSPE